MSSVTVLTPHGRRQVVKIEPNKTILWVNIAKNQYAESSSKMFSIN